MTSTVTAPRRAVEAPALAGTDEREGYLELQARPEFIALRRLRRAVIFPASALFLTWYLVFVLLADYAHGLMNTRIGDSNITLGLIFGLLQFLSTFLIAGLYVRFANRHLDPEVDHIRERWERVER